MSRTVRAAKREGPRKTKVIGASLNAEDEARLKRYIAREAKRGVRLRPGQAVGALMRRGLDVAEAEAAG